MREALRKYLPWALSANTLFFNLAVGQHDARGWAFALAGQAVWFVWVIADRAWGLLPLTVALTFVYARNYIIN